MCHVYEVKTVSFSKDLCRFATGPLKFLKPHNAPTDHFQHDPEGGYMRCSLHILLVLSLVGCQTKQRSKSPSSAPDSAIEQHDEEVLPQDELVSEIHHEVESIQDDLRDFAEEVASDPNATREEKQIGSIAETGAEQPSDLATQMILSDMLDKIGDEEQRTEEALTHVKAEVDEDGKIVVSKDEEAAAAAAKEEEESEGTKSKAYQRAGIYMTVMGSLGILTAYPYALYVGLNVLDPSVRSAKVNSSVMKTLLEGYGDDDDFKKRLRANGILGPAEIALLSSFVVTLGFSIAMTAIGAKVVHQDSPSDTLVKAGGVMLIGGGLLSTALALKVGHNVWLANTTYRGKFTNLGIFTMLPLAFGVSSIAVGTTTMLELASDDRPVTRLLKTIGPKVERIHKLRGAVIRQVKGRTL